MARLLGPDMGSRFCYTASGAPAAGAVAVVYANAAGTAPADILAYQPGDPDVPGGAILNSQITCDADGLLPYFWLPDGSDRVWVSVNGGTVTPIDADYNARIDKGGPGLAWVDAALRPGIDPTGVADCTAGINTLFASLSAGQTVYWRAGIYKITGAVNPPPSNVTITSDGFGALWEFSPAAAGATMLTLDGSHRDTKWVGMRFRIAGVANGPTARLVKLNGTFRNSFHRCSFVGQHTTSGDAYGVNTHVGVVIMGNSGDNTFVDCDWLNLGVGIMTDSIMNSIIGGKVGTCWIGIWGTRDIDGTTRANAGMSITGGVDFVSASTAGLVAYNILIDAPANQWWISHTWFEGADIGISAGSAATSGGPTQFGLAHCKIAATTKCLDVVWCRQARLDNVQFAANGAATPTSLTIGSNAPEGVATNLISLITGDPAISGSDYALSGFPGRWSYLGRLRAKLPDSGVQIGTGSQVFSGNGAPSAGTGVDGDFWFRKDGGSGTRIYFKAAGAWAAIV